MATDLERLIVSLEASITKYEKSMNKALGISTKNAKAIENRWKKLDIGATAFAGFVKGAGAALVSALSLGAAIRGTKDALKEFGDISDSAKAAGVDAEFFQSIAYQAQQGGIEIDAISGALATFAKNSGLAIEGRGKMVASLKALDSGLLENIRHAITQEDRIKLVADALAKETDASRRAAIATAAFGDAGLRLADVFKGGAAEIETMQVKAKELGLIVDRDLIARADELGDEFDTTTKIVDLQLKQALVNLGPILVWLTGLAGGIAEQVSGTVDALKPLIEQRRSTIEGTLAGIDLRQNDVNPAMTAGLSQADADALRKPLLEELKRRAMDDLRRQLTAIQPPTTADIPTLDEVESRNKAAQAAIKQAEATKAYIENLKFENSLIGLTALEQAKLTAVRQSGAAAASEEAAEIAKLAEEGYLHNQQVEAMTALYEELGSIGKAAVQGIVEALADGKVEGKEMMDILSNVLGMASQFFLNQAFGGGGGGNIFGSLFGGGRASGGAVQAGKIYKVNENTPNSEYFAPGVDGMIVPKLSRPSTQTAGGAMLNLTVNMPAGDATQRLKDFVRFELPGLVLQTVNDPHARG